MPCIELGASCRPENGGPTVGWSLDQKEKIKSAFFIGYVLLQVSRKFTNSQYVQLQLLYNSNYKLRTGCDRYIFEHSVGHSVIFRFEKHYRVMWPLTHLIRVTKKYGQLSFFVVENFVNFVNFQQYWQYYNSDNWKPESMTIFVTWKLRVTLDSICSSCDALWISHSGSECPCR